MLWKSSFPQILLGCSFDLELGKALLELEKTLAISRLPLRRLVAITNGAVASRAALCLSREEKKYLIFLGNICAQELNPSFSIETLLYHHPPEYVEAYIALWAALRLKLKSWTLSKTIPLLKEYQKKYPFGAPLSFP